MQPEKIGRYEVKCELGKGSMATVFCAHDPYFARDVALKWMARDTLKDPTFRERFMREARIAASLENAAIVPVYDFGEYDEIPYLVMRYMVGGSLATRLKSGAFTPTETLPVMERLTAALSEAHAKGIIHRDIKPANILLDGQGQAYLTDFGIAKLLVSSATPLTKSGVVGTPAYMSPEQAKGMEFIDQRSDIYALGLVLFEMLTGKRPYEGGDNAMQYALMHVVGPVPHITDIVPDFSSELDQVISRALAKDAKDRYATADELALALRQSLEGVTTEPQNDEVPTARVIVPQTTFAKLIHKDGTRIDIQTAEFSIGRKSEEDLDLAPWDVGKFVSRRHAQILFRDNTWFIRSAEGARNPTRVNGIVVEAGTEVQLQEGDDVQFANIHFRFSMK